MNPKLFLGLLAITMLAAGCGSKTDPTSDYKDLGDSVPLYNGQPHAQEVLPANVFHVEMPGNMNFVEGQEASYDIVVQTQLHGISFALTASGLPAGVSLVQVDATHYKVQGIVPVGGSLGLQQGQKVPVTISAVNAKGDQTEVHMFNSLLHSWSPTVTVFATDKVPMVESQNITGLSVNEGETLPIAIIVTDLGSHDSAMPQIQSPFQDEMNSGEVTFVPAMPGLRISRTPSALGDHKYKFTGTLDTKLLALPAGKKNVTARFVVNFKSPSGLVSADEIIDVKIVRAAAPAPVAAPAAAPAPVTAPAPAVAPVAKVVPESSAARKVTADAVTAAPEKAAPAKKAAAPAKKTAAPAKKAVKKEAKP
jgi:hypothetical protein